MLKHSVNHLRHGYTQLFQPVTNTAKQVFLPQNFVFILDAVSPSCVLSDREICICVANHAKQLKSAGHFHKRIKENATQKNTVSQAYEKQKLKSITVQPNISSPTSFLEKGHRN